MRGQRGEAQGAPAGWVIARNRSLRGGWVLMSVREMLSVLSAESQIVVTCEKFNRKFLARLSGNFKV